MRELSVSERAGAILGLRFQILGHSTDPEVGAEWVSARLLEAAGHAMAVRFFGAARQLTAFASRPLFDTDLEELDNLLIVLQRAARGYADAGSSTLCES